MLIRMLCELKVHGVIGWDSMETPVKPEPPCKPSLTEKSPSLAKPHEIRIEVNATSATSLAIVDLQMPDDSDQTTPVSRGNWVSALSGTLGRSPKRSSPPRSPIRQRSMSPGRMRSSLTAADAIVMNVKGNSMGSLCSHALQVRATGLLLKLYRQF
jgi:hypothetical protein